MPNGTAEPDVGDAGGHRQAQRAGDGPRGDGRAAPVPYALAEYDAQHDLELHTHASAEAQVAALSDDIAYNNHDLHDGLRAELFSTDELADLPILREMLRAGGCGAIPN